MLVLWLARIGNNITVMIDQEFGEIPFNTFAPENASSRFF
ncbi:MAG: hypothetical protein ACJAQ6_001952 [Arenicella sp.]